MPVNRCDNASIMNTKTGNRQLNASCCTKVMACFTLVFMVYCKVGRWSIALILVLYSMGNNALRKN